MANEIVEWTSYVQHQLQRTASICIAETGVSSQRFHEATQITNFLLCLQSYSRGWVGGGGGGGGGGDTKPHISFKLL